MNTKSPTSCCNFPRPQRRSESITWALHSADVTTWFQTSMTTNDVLFWRLGTCKFKQIVILDARSSLRRLKISVYRNMTQCSLVTRRQRFGGKCCVSTFRVLRNDSLSLYPVTALHVRSILLPWREKGHFPPTGRQYQKQDVTPRWQ